MLKIEDNEVVQFRASSLGKLIRILEFQFKHYCSEMALIYSTYGKNPTPEKIDGICPEYFDRSITATVFTGMIMEAFFFDFAAVKRSNSYAKEISGKTIDKGFSKIAKDIFGMEGSKEADFSDRLERFRKVRVHFVHNKSTELGNYNKKNLDYFSPDGCLQLLIDLFEYFSKMDQEYVLAQIIFDKLSRVQVSERGF